MQRSVKYNLMGWKIIRVSIHLQYVILIIYLLLYMCKPNERDMFNCKKQYDR